ncbi:MULTISPECIES: hypothetical protein [unclassified Rhizobium]|uniref:hypothetical protein n=1 Tax=unclassified Rhizobium TaxID=2613769 RepID=UPI001618B832|nr:MULTISPECIES: hypothetical protein [unclassified Rhizobium]MBB3288149.1 hypothetical protein [Rhizobium sp. BK252]MBB3402987.1 hypothetical protein [Rhizobium sp. BK289]MBB3415564.1 hypothetical protein [Rhizobium sp. BK284]MBB3483355.1 hypothetical protein [Rhizobium sp. BK347]
MTKFAMFDANGLPVAFYAEDIHGSRTRPVYGANDDGEAIVIGSEPNPDCSIPAGTIEIDDSQWMEFLSNAGCRKWLNGQLVEYTPPPPIPTLADYTAAITRMLDAKAQERRYDNAVSIATYAGSSNAAWSAEAQAFIAWRDQIWAYCYAELDKVQAGEREQPTIAEFMAELETQFPLTWPEA